jgi:methylglutaconyl-CoA hydratase
MAPLDVRREGPLLRVTLTRPEKRNAFDGELVAALTAAFTGVGDARAVVLRGEGGSFSAGADADWMRASLDLTLEQNLDDARALRRLLDVLDGCPAPVVAVVQGHALGGGCGLLACCDVVVAERGATFGFTEVRLGIVPAVISPFVVARIGPGAARRLFVTGERFDAETALRIGLVHELVDDLDAGVDRVLTEVLAGGPEAVRVAKRIGRGGLSAEESAALIAELRTGEEGQEGLRAFLEKRPPAWGGPPDRAGRG